MHSPARNGSLAVYVIRRLCALRSLSKEGIALLEQLLHDNMQRAVAGEDIIREGDTVDSVRIILSGWLCRYKMLEDGRRQIVNFILPGDSCDAYAYLLSVMDHSIATLTPTIFSDVKRADFEKLLTSDRLLAEAFWCEMLLDGMIQREWTVNLGRRVALERVAHLFCEIFERLRPLGLLERNSCSFPVTQVDMADATGLSVVHVNRTVQELRNSGLIVLRDRTLTINDLQALKSTALFSDNYLHPGWRSTGR